MIEIMFINNDGAGFADRINVRSGITVRELFDERMPRHAEYSSYRIRVNSASTSADRVLQGGDRISITPAKIEGAC